MVPRLGISTDYAAYLCDWLSREGYLSPLAGRNAYCFTERGKAARVSELVRVDGALDKRLGWLSCCCICGGKGTVAVVEPHVVCRFCSTTGVEPFSRLTCLACRGKGVMTIAQPTEGCLVCKGTGRHTSHLYCLRCHGAGVVSLVPASTAREGSGEGG